MQNFLRIMRKVHKNLISHENLSKNRSFNRVEIFYFKSFSSSSSLFQGSDFKRLIENFFQQGKNRLNDFSFVSPLFSLPIKI